MPIANAIAWVACWYRNQNNDALTLTPELIKAFEVADQEVNMGEKEKN